MIVLFIVKVKSLFLNVFHNYIAFIFFFVEKFEGLDANLYTLEDKLEVLRDRTVLFIGDDKRKLLNLYLTFRRNCYIRFKRS